MSPSHPEANYRMAVLLRVMARVEEAIPLFEKVAQGDSEWKEKAEQALETLRHGRPVKHFNMTRIIQNSQFREHKSLIWGFVLLRRFLPFLLFLHCVSIIGFSRCYCPKMFLYTKHLLFSLVHLEQGQHFCIVFYMTIILDEDRNCGK